MSSKSDEGLKATFEVLVDEELVSRGSTRIASRLHNRRVLHRRAQLAGAGLVTLACATVAVSGSLGGFQGAAHSDEAANAPDPSQRGAEYVQALPQGDAPCVGGRRAELRELSDSLGRPIPVPNSSLASNKNLSGIWLCGGTPELIFDSGVRVFYLPNDGGLQASFDRIAKESDGEVRTVGGRPTLVQAPDAQTYGQIMTTIGRTLIEIQGTKPGLDTEDLVGVAAGIG